MGAAKLCLSCHAPVVWAQTERGKRIPIDREPRPDGNLVLLGDILAGQGTLFAAIFDPIRHTGKTRFVSHFATCPHAGEHRRR